MRIEYINWFNIVIRIQASDEAKTRVNWRFLQKRDNYSPQDSLSGRTCANLKIGKFTDQLENSFIGFYWQDINKSKVINVNVLLPKHFHSFVAIYRVFEIWPLNDKAYGTLKLRKVSLWDCSDNTSTLILYFNKRSDQIFNDTKLEKQLCSYWWNFSFQI